VAQAPRLRRSPSETATTIRPSAHNRRRPQFMALGAFVVARASRPRVTKARVPIVARAPRLRRSPFGTVKSVGPTYRHRRRGRRRHKNRKGLAPPSQPPTPRTRPALPRPSPPQCDVIHHSSFITHHSWHAPRRHRNALKVPLCVTWSVGLRPLRPLQKATILHDDVGIERTRRSLRIGQRRSTSPAPRNHRVVLAF